MSLQNQFALITGGNSGIGFAIAQSFVQAGASVAISGRNPETLNRAVQELGPKAVGIQADISTDQGRNGLFEALAKKTKRLDILVVNAGQAQFRPLDQVDGAFFDNQFDTNVKGALFTVKEALPFLGAGSSVLFISSVVKDRGFAGSSVYTATKGAISAMVKALAAELGPQGIRVNAISPGPIETPIFDKMEVPAEQKPAMKEGFASMVPLKRFGRPEEVANVALLLSSSAGSYLHGVDIPVDGGLAQI
ncbi:MAG: SDR family oxidoreductase [Acidobacteria bacterium]|nr:SDR family oxidoreductase [Acidobacteriota bacterium]MCB9399389.1 SDR family oxidoreductase [Acidobacteriota bacterium]